MCVNLANVRGLTLLWFYSFISDTCSTFWHSLDEFQVVSGISMSKVFLVVISNNFTFFSTQSSQCWISMTGHIEIQGQKVWCTWDWPWRPECYRGVSLRCWKVFAGAFKCPSFGNGEAPLWSVAVCVSGRFNLSCHRINFHVGENQDCASKVCISCERVRPEPPCLPWCMQELCPCTLVHCGVLACIAWACDLTFWLLVIEFIVRCCVHRLTCMPWLWGLVTCHHLACIFLVHCGIVALWHWVVKDDSNL